ncbi:MAG: hypothetical protein GXO10_02065 [Crenarchaeota archaeon]|nr:hypothetical protein [Thermoproteota archaeon]
MAREDRRDSILRKIDPKKLLILSILFILILAICPSFARFILFLALLGLFIYIAGRDFPDIVELFKRKTLNATVKAVKRYIAHDVVEVKPILVEVGRGETIVKIGDSWVRLFEIEDELPENVVRLLEKDDHVIIIRSGNSTYVLVRGEDIEEVDDKARLIEKLLEKHGVSFRLLSSEKALNMILTLFRM